MLFKRGNICLFVYEYFQIKCDNSQIIDKNEKLEDNE